MGYPTNNLPHFAKLLKPRPYSIQDLNKNLRVLVEVALASP
jgi:hypothetical protein